MAGAISIRVKEEFFIAEKLRLNRPYLKRNVSQAIQSLRYRAHSSYSKSVSSEEPPREFISHFENDKHKDDKEAEEVEDVIPEKRPAKRTRILLEEKSEAKDHERPEKRQQIQELGTSLLERFRDEMNLESQLPDYTAKQSSNSKFISTPSRPNLVLSTDFNGNSCSSRSLLLWPMVFDNRGLLNEKLPALPFIRALKVDVSEILPSNMGERDTFYYCNQNELHYPIRYTAKCFCDLFHKKEATAEWTHGVRKAVSCSLNVSFGLHGEVYRSIKLRQPFLFLEDDLLCSQKTTRLSRPAGVQLYEVEDLPLISKLVITIQSRPDHFSPAPPVGWPSFQIPKSSNPDLDAEVLSQHLHDGSIDKKDLSLFFESNSLDPGDRPFKSLGLMIGTDYPKPVKQRMPFNLRTEISWSHPPQFSIKLLAPTCFLNSCQALSEVSNTRSPMESRTRRDHPNAPTYNFFKLSRGTQGKSPCIRKNSSRFITQQRQDLDCACIQPYEDQDEHTITYCFREEDASGHVTNQECSQDGARWLVCIFCGINHHSVKELRLHLFTDHSGFKVFLRSSKPLVFSVEIRKTRSVADYQRTFQLGKPRNLLDLERYLNGDEIWLKRRLGPLHNASPEYLNHNLGENPCLSSSPHDSRDSSPNTSNCIEVELPCLEPKIPRPSHAKPKLLVPQPPEGVVFYHTVTKQILSPGDPIPASDDEMDDFWLRQRHRTSVNEFGDVTVEEKEYINIWNPFIAKRKIKIPHTKYLPDAILKFIDAHKYWILSQPERRKEFFKHLEVLILRGTIDEAFRRRCRIILRDAEKFQMVPTETVIEA